MRQKWLLTVVLLVAGAIGLHAQEYGEKVDTVVVRPIPLSTVNDSVFFNPWQPYYLSPDAEAVENKEQRAARINRETFQRVMASVNHNLSWHRPPELTGTEKALLFIGSLFLTSPYQFREGTVPVMSASNPFMFAYTPGGAPVVYPYSTDAFPQCIRLDYDFMSGTYKQVMVKWEDVQRSMVRSFGGPYRTEAVPKMQFHSTDKLVP